MFSMEVEYDREELQLGSTGGAPTALFLLRPQGCRIVVEHLHNAGPAVIPSATC